MGFPDVLPIVTSRHGVALDLLKRRLGSPAQGFAIGDVLSAGLHADNARQQSLVEEGKTPWNGPFASLYSGAVLYVLGHHIVLDNLHLPQQHLQESLFWSNLNRGSIMTAARLLLRSVILTAVLAGTLPRVADAQAPKTNLTVEDVVKMTQSGLADDLIITKVKQNGKVFDLSAEELLDLKKAGVSDNVVKYLLDPTQPYAPPAPPAAAPVAPAPPKPIGPAKQYPPDALASKVPPDPGLYHFQKDAPEGIDIKLLLGEVNGAGVGKVLKMKGKVIAYLVGPAARLRIKEPAPVYFYMRLPEGKGIEEVVLVAFEKKKGRREIEVGPAGPKQELKPEAMRQFDPLEVGPRVFKLTVGKLVKGEYIFFLLGSADPPKGSQGKGYDFGMGEP
jgi:hypothetical protein